MPRKFTRCLHSSLPPNSSSAIPTVPAGTGRSKPSSCGYIQHRWRQEKQEPMQEAIALPLLVPSRKQSCGCTDQPCSCCGQALPCTS